MKSKIRENVVTTKEGETRYKEAIDARWIASKGKQYYGNTGIGLFPVSSTFRRFSASFYYEYLTKVDNHTFLTEEEFKNLGY